MKVFKVKSSLFLEDEVQEKIKEIMSNLCENVLLEDDVLTFYLF